MVPLLIHFVCVEVRRGHSFMIHSRVGISCCSLECKGILRWLGPHIQSTCTPHIRFIFTARPTGPKPQHLNPDPRVQLTQAWLPMGRERQWLPHPWSQKVGGSSSKLSCIAYTYIVAAAFRHFDALRTLWCSSEYARVLDTARQLDVGFRQGCMRTSGCCFMVSCRWSCFGNVTRVERAAVSGNDVKTLA